jgi:preprotein translocase subunit YajC
MDLNSFTVLLAQATAQAAAPTTQPNQQAEIMKLVSMLVMFGVVFYLVAIRPQQKRNREQADLLKSVKPGDKIQTSGGIIATVVTVKDKSLTVRSADSKMEINKAAIVEITERAGESSAS